MKNTHLTYIQNVNNTLSWKRLINFIPSYSSPQFVYAFFFNRSVHGGTADSCRKFCVNKSNKTIISNKTTRGYEIAGNFRSHYTSICFDDNLPRVSVANE
jgi:hypothetical protein